ncbi:MAG: glycosyltransferase [Thermodesulfobacteriota bacterium]|nr:glycosyltransferase [Thermodesulfobacteriota bacterium]
MKVVIVGKSKRRTKTYYYFNKAFQQNGHKTIWIKFSKIKSYFGKNLATAICDKVISLFKPDLLFFHGRDISYELLSRVKERMPVVMYFDDCLKGIRSSNFEELIKFARQADIMYLTNRGEIPQYQKHGVNAKFMPGGCDLNAHYMVEKPGKFYQSEVAFIGNVNTPERTECMREVAKHFDLKLWGAGWEKVGMKSEMKDVYVAEYRKICAGAKIILGWNIDPTIDLYFSNRTWFTLGCGGFLLTAYSPSLEELFGRKRELDWFETIEECCEKIRYYLQHDKERKKIAEAGYHLAHNKYSYAEVVKKITEDMLQ